MLVVRSRTDQCGEGDYPKNKVRKRVDGEGKRGGSWRCSAPMMSMLMGVVWRLALIRADTGLAKSPSNQRTGSALRAHHCPAKPGDDVQLTVTCSTQISIKLGNNTMLSAKEG
jgi:hypothetical protein